jgi:hypothetical protein
MPGVANGIVMFVRQRTDKPGRRRLESGLAPTLMCGGELNRFGFYVKVLDHERKLDANREMQRESVDDPCFIRGCRAVPAN